MSNTRSLRSNSLDFPVGTEVPAVLTINDLNTALEQQKQTLISDITAVLEEKINKLTTTINTQAEQIDTLKKSLSEQAEIIESLKKDNLKSDEQKSRLNF